MTADETKIIVDTGVIVSIVAGAIGGILILLLGAMSYFARKELEYIKQKLNELTVKNEQHNITGVEVSAQMMALSERVLRLERKIDNAN